MQFPCQKNLLEKTDQNWRKDLQLMHTQMFKKIKNWKRFLGPIGGLQNTRPKNFRKSTRARGIYLDAIKTHNILDNTDQLLTPTRSDTY